MCFTSSRKNGEAGANSRHTDRILSKDEMRSTRKVKILLLGAGDSGKSTIIKQMKFIHCQSLQIRERLWWRPVIFRHIVEALRTIQGVMIERNYQFDDLDKEQFMNNILMRHKLGHKERPPQDWLGQIKDLWHDNGVKAALTRGQEYSIFDNLPYFIDQLDRIWADGYIPNNSDILYSRLKTTGIAESEFVLGHLTYRMIDVGGQRSERRKWIHCFENVHCLLFLVAINGYDQCLVEDRETNQMIEALALWEYIVNSRWFAKTSTILFLNKMDLFIKKLPLSPITSCGYADYRGRPDDYKSAGGYFLDKFRAQNRYAEKEIYGHFTNATDTNLVKITMESVQSMIIHRNLKLLVI